MEALCFSSIIFFVLLFYMVTVENVNVLTTLAMAGITPLCELHTS